MPQGQITLALDWKDRFFDTVTSNAEGQGNKNMPEVYLSTLSEIVHGAPVIFNGNPDHHTYWFDRRTQPWVVKTRALNPTVD